MKFTPTYTILKKKNSKLGKDKRNMIGSRIKTKRKILRDRSITSSKTRKRRSKPFILTAKIRG